MTEVKFLYFSVTEQGPTETNPTTDTSTLAGLALSGNLGLSGGARVTGVPDIPSAGTDAVNQNYVDSVVSGLGWKQPVAAPKLIGNVKVMGLVGNAAAVVIEALSVEGDAYVVSTANGVGALATAAVGDIWQYVSGAWSKIVSGSGGFVANGTYALLSTTTALLSPYTDVTDDGKRAFFDGTTLTGTLFTQADGDAYVIDGVGAKGQGSLIEWNSSAWFTLEAGVGGFVPANKRAILGLAPVAVLITPYVEGTDDGKIVRFTGLSNTGTYTTDAVDAAAVLVQDSGHIGFYDNIAFVFEGTVPTGSWVQFTGAGSITAGDGLVRVGNTISVGKGDGIAIAPDAISIDLDTTTPGLILNGTSPNKKLNVKVGGANGIVLGATGVELEIDATPGTLKVDADGLGVTGLPSLFTINDAAVSSNVTATNLNTLTAGSTSNADSLHTHAITAVDEAKRIENTFVNNTAVTAGRVVRMSSVNNQVIHADNSTASNAQAIGVARVGGAGDPGTSEIVSQGLCAGVLAGATVNTAYYLGANGALVTIGSVPTPGRVLRVGYAVNATDLFVDFMDFGKKL